MVPCAPVETRWQTGGEGRTFETEKKKLPRLKSTGWRRKEKDREGGGCETRSERPDESSPSGKKRGTKRKACGSYTSLNIGITRMPVPWRLYLAARLYTPRYSDDCREQDILRGTRSLFPSLSNHRGWGGGGRGRRGVKATARNSSPFVGYQANANRCLRFRSMLRFRASRGHPSSFFPSRSIAAGVQSRPWYTDCIDTR